MKSAGDGPSHAIYIYLARNCPIAGATAVIVVLAAARMFETGSVLMGVRALE